MPETRALVTVTVTCHCSNWHRPKIRVIDRHHIVPLSWGGPDTKLNTVTICSNQHRLVHELLVIYKKNKGVVSTSDLRPFPRYTRKLAKQGWENWMELKGGQHAT